MTRAPSRKPKPRATKLATKRTRGRGQRARRSVGKRPPRRGRTRKQVLVTGGAGFIGSHLCDRLIANGYAVVALDNLTTGSRKNLEHLRREPSFTLIEHDVREAYDLPVQQIFNLACPASPVHYQTDPVATWKTSIFGAVHALELARRRGARVFQASTSEVYGDPTVHPQPESYWGNVNPIGIRACYDEGKRAAETLFFDYARRYRTDIRVARIFNTYGPRMLPHDGRVVSNFIVQALKGEPITIYGDGSQTRSFCYVDDLVEGFLRLMADNAPHGPVNLGNPGEFTVAELAEKVLAMTGSRSHRVFKPLPADDPTRRRPEISVAQEKLGWKPTVALPQGLERTIAYFRQAIASS
ncbi:MAG: SDR family oxidoreductase [Deltaproteobacteria bacterium]|nr:SDR family oxidoreductase [Deltaproteobacteria bacterium]